MGVLKTLYVSVLMAFPLGALVRIKLTDSAYVYPIDILLGILLMVFFYECVLNKLYKKLPLFKSALFVVAWMVLSLLLNSGWLNGREWMVSSMYIARFSLYASLIFITSSFPESFKKKVPLLLVNTILTTVLLGFIQYVFYPGLHNLYYLGWDEHYFRIFSTFLDPNFTGVIFTLCFIMLLGFLFFYKGKSVRALTILGLTAAVAAIFLTYSRTTYLTLLSSSVVFLLYTRRVKFLLSLLGLFLVLLIVIPKNLSSEGVDLLRTTSIFSRLDSYQQSLEVIYKSPLFGVGFNTYRYAAYKLGVVNESNWVVSHSGAGVPNSYLIILATMGVIGFLVVVNFFYNMLRIIHSKKSKSNYDLYIKSVTIACVVGVLVGSLVENLLFYPFIMVILFSLIGVSVGKNKN